MSESEMRDDRTEVRDRPVIRFSMPSLAPIDATATSDASAAVTTKSDVESDDTVTALDALVAQAVAAVDLDDDLDPEVQIVDDFEPSHAATDLADATPPPAPVGLQPPSADTRAEYMYALVEAERAKILAEMEPKVTLRDRLRRRKK